MRTAQKMVPGLFIVALGLTFLWFGRGYPVGTVRSMGPGMFPMALSILAIATGALIVVTDFIRAEDARMPFRWSAVAAVLGALLAFSLLLEPAGLLPTGCVAVAILALAEGRVRPVECAILGVVLSLAVWAVFGRGLGMPVHLLPEVF